ncbi:MAG TPA: phosphatase PAP2 family protein [Polyangia bacterium]|nr:phosphatase PAP2 family protein [Polyangia bacterium]
MKTARITAAVVTAALALGPSSSARAEEVPPSRLPDNQHFTVDPIVDGVIILGGGTFDVLLALVLSTGEIKPLPPSADAPSHLLGIDRVAVTQTPSASAGRYSNIGLAAACAYAVIDPLMSGVRDGRRSLAVDAIMYAESIAITLAVTDATKIAVRRPRPIDYAACSGMTTASECNQTDLQLSFFSGHASTTAAITATASYLAFVRSGWRRPRAWLTLGVGTAVTALVSYWRVRSGEHFPTDVIMGATAGAGIGVLVPHFHRRPHYHDRELEAPPVIIGYAPVLGGGEVTLRWSF